VGVGFRVVDIPGGHSLVSPEGVEELTDFWLDPEALFFMEIADPRVPEHVATTDAGDDGAAAFAAAVEACGDEEPIDEEDPDLIAAGNVLLELIGEDFEFEDVSCNDVGALQALSSQVLAAREQVAYVEGIQLSLPEAPEEPAEPPAAQPVQQTPTFTG
jgi:hypothetical protein